MNNPLTPKDQNHLDRITKKLVFVRRLAFEECEVRIDDALRELQRNLHNSNNAIRQTLNANSIEEAEEIVKIVVPFEVQSN